MGSINKKIKLNNKLLCETYFNKRNVWIFNKLPDNKLIQTCIRTNMIKLQTNFEIRLFGYSTIKNLLPEFIKYINLCRSGYLFENLLKYAILFKYGGLWIPSDTIIINNLGNNFHDLTNKIYLFGLNDLNYTDTPGFSDDIVLCNKENKTIKTILDYVIMNIYSFHNSSNYKLIINKYINNFSDDLVIFKGYRLQKTIFSKFIDPDSIINERISSIIDKTNKYFYIIQYDNLKNRTKHILNIKNPDNTYNSVNYINNFIT
tara:strand:+ start:597 stop:1376 length:780 start_codon:yes stop_codon:yes gene_type:complete